MLIYRNQSCIIYNITFLIIHDLLNTLYGLMIGVYEYTVFSYDYIQSHDLKQPTSLSVKIKYLIIH